MQTLKEHKKETLKAFQEEFGIHFKNSKGELQFAQTFIEEALDKQIEIIKELLPEEDVGAYDPVSSIVYRKTFNDCLNKVKEILK